jgi:two-component system, cell cycle response regulator
MTVVIDSSALTIGTALAIGGVGGAVLANLVFKAVWLRRLTAYAEALVRPDDNRPPRSPGSGRLARALEQVGSRLAAVETMATTDQLTGVLNRQASLRRLALELERASRYDHPIAVGLADIDHFKRVNDTYGHGVGDLVLRHVAQLLRANLRSVDSIGRYGGEEFLVILPEADVDGAADALEKLRRLIGRSPVTLPDGASLAVTISIGVAAGSGQGIRLDEITRDADTALYAAKSLGRDQVYVFKELDDERTIHRSPLTAAARDEAMSVGRRAAESAEDRLSEILAPRPGWAGKPSNLIADLAVRLATSIGLSDGEVRRIRTASLLHDVGKIAISEELLSKPSELSSGEWRTVMEHPKVGQIVLEQAGAMRDAATIALHHHEWFNGRGYPHGLAGADIPIGARIVAIADAYEAMTSSRPYQRTRTHEDALGELRRCAGTQFDPELVEAFIAQMGEAPTLARAAHDGAERTGTEG